MSGLKRKADRRLTGQLMPIADIAQDEFEHGWYASIGTFASSIMITRQSLPHFKLLSSTLKGPSIPDTPFFIR